MAGRFGPIKTAVLMTIAAASVGATIVLQFSQRSPIDLREASTAQLGLMVALLVLPMLTLWLGEADRRERSRGR